MGFIWDAFRFLWEFLKGKKSYVVGLSAVVYGWYVGDRDAVLLGLGLIGIRHGITTEISNAFISKKK